MSTEPHFKWLLDMSCPRKMLCGGTEAIRATSQRPVSLNLCPVSCATSAISVLVNLALSTVERSLVMAENERKQRKMFQRVVVGFE